MTFNLVWLAGLFDGEGHVTLTHSPNGRTDGGRTFRLQVGIAQNNREFLEALRTAYGGYIWGVQLMLQSRKAEAFLREVEPHVVLKRDVVRLALEYRTLVGKRTPEAEQRSLEIREEIMRLNSLN